MPTSIVITIGCFIIAAIVGLDVWFAVDKISGNTWSELIRVMAKKTLFIPYICGVLSGHFFWPEALSSYIPLFDHPQSIALLVWIGCIVGILGLGFVKVGISAPLWSIFVLGFLGGMLLWPVGK